jgi:hypothetical protein
MVTPSTTTTTLFWTCWEVWSSSRPVSRPLRLLRSSRRQLSRSSYPEFWPYAPGIWFARAELRFEVSGVIAERQKFAYTVDALHQQHTRTCSITLRRRAGRPVASKYRRLDPVKLAAAKQEFAEMERQGIIRRSSTQWA